MELFSCGVNHVNDDKPYSGWCYIRIILWMRYTLLLFARQKMKLFLSKEDFHLCIPCWCILNSKTQSYNILLFPRGTLPSNQSWCGLRSWESKYQRWSQSFWHWTPSPPSCASWSSSQTAASAHPGRKSKASATQAGSCRWRPRWSDESQPTSPPH